MSPFSPSCPQQPDPFPRTRAINPAVSCACGLLNSLAALFASPGLCFQHFAHSFVKIGGWVPQSLAQRYSSPLRYPCPSFCPRFVFIHLQIPPHASSIWNWSIFRYLQIPFPANTLFSDLYKTPGCHPSHFQFAIVWSERRCGISSFLR